MSEFKPVGKIEAVSKDVLFAGSKVSSDSPSGGAEEPVSSANSTSNALAEARQNLEERGEKLNQLSDKTDKLATASSEFADMAKQLRKQNQKSSFGFFF